MLGVKVRGFGCLWHATDPPQRMQRKLFKGAWRARLEVNDIGVESGPKGFEPVRDAGNSRMDNQYARASRESLACNRGDVIPIVASGDAGATEFQHDPARALRRSEWRSHGESLQIVVVNIAQRFLEFLLG